MDIFDEIDYYNNTNSDLNIINIPSRYLRDLSDPYEIEINAFKMRYRFSQDSVKNVILPIVIPDLQKINRRGLPLPPEIQILACLRFYATASFQIVCGDLLNISQPAVSTLIANISRILALRHGEYVKYPTNMAMHRMQFAQNGQIDRHGGLQNVDGAIDCTHIKIVNTPGVQHHEAVVGPTGQFMDLVARWAGSTHDSRIFQMSTLNMKYVQGIHTGKLVGDSGYPCLRYLLTPINTPMQPSEEVYNKVHAKTRNIVERAFGQWKRRFPCLQRGLGNKLTTVSNIIVACAVLYNISKNINDDSPADEDLTDEEVIIDELNEPHNVGGSADGFAIRAAIVNNYTHT